MNYNLLEIQTSFLSLVKFKPDFDTNKLDSDLIGISNTGKYFNIGVSSLLTLKNIFALMPLVRDWNINAYSNTATYSIDQIVSSEAKYYISLVDGNTGNALTSADHWKETTLESVWIKRQINGVIEQVMSKSVLADNLIDSGLIYTVCDGSEQVENSNNYVGFEIRPEGSNNLKLILNRLGAQFSDVNENIPIYLYNQNTKVNEGVFSNTAKEFQWNDLSEVEITGQGRWFLFYDQAAITGQAYTYPFYAGLKNVSLLPFEVPNTTTDFLTDVDEYSGHSYGLGLDISVKADLTSFLIKNRFVFAEAIQLQFGYNMLEQFLHNPDHRINTNTGLNEKEMVIGELKSETKYSLASKLDRAFRKVEKSLNFGEVTLPCEEESTITHTNFG